MSDIQDMKDWPISMKIMKLKVKSMREKADLKDEIISLLSEIIDLEEALAKMKDEREEREEREASWLHGSLSEIEVAQRPRSISHIIRPANIGCNGSKEASKAKGDEDEVLTAEDNALLSERVRRNTIKMVFDQYNMPLPEYQQLSECENCGHYGHIKEICVTTRHVDNLQLDRY
eukprot:sb/3471978/